jgi:hypothetical protein
MNGNCLCICYKLQRRMSMLEWRTTTRDDKVTNGRQLHNHIIITTTQNSSQRTMLSIYINNILKTSKALKVKDQEE